MVVQPGVELIDKKRNIKGDQIVKNNQISLKEYQKLTDPKKQIAQSSSLGRDSNGGHSSRNQNEFIESLGEDPYIAF
jgi:hypothetical protein